MRPAPAWWVVIGPPGQGPELRDELLSTPVDGDTLVVDLSDGWAHVAVTGVEAAELISAATSFDVHPRHFPAHVATFTDVLGLRALLRRRTDGFDIGFERSHAAYVMDWFARLQGHVAAPSATVDPGKSGGRT